MAQAFASRGLPHFFVVATSLLVVVEYSI